MTPSLGPDTDRRWPRSVFGVGTEPDPRFSFANERTFLAWIRTALGFLAGGVAVAALADFKAGLSIETRIAALVMISCGLITGVSAMNRWIRNERAIRLGQPLPSSAMMPLLTAGIVIVALIAFIVVSF